ncbi:MAG: DMT family transporter [Hyphomicrobiales bacterium]
MTRQRQADVLLFTTTVLAAFGWIFSREAISGMPPFLFVGARFVVATLVLLPFNRGVRLERSQWRGSVISGLWFALQLCLWTHSLSTARSLGEGAFIVSLSMLFVPLTAWVMARVRPARAYWECLPIAVAGLALLSLQVPVDFHPSQGWWLLTAVAQSIWFVYTSRQASGVPAIPLTTVQLSVTAVVALTLSAFTESWTQPIALSTIGWLLASALIATSLRFAIQIQGQKHAAVASAAFIMMLEPVFTAIAAALWFGEQLPVQKILGGALILFAQFWYRWRLWRQAPPPLGPH